MYVRTTADFFKDLRSDLADCADVGEDGGPRDTLWSDCDLLRYLNSAASRLASDALGLRKRFVLDVKADNPLLPLPYWQVLDFVAVSFRAPELGSSEYYLRNFDIDEGFAREDYGVQRHVRPDFTTKGTPSHYTRDWDNENMRLYPVPAIDGVVTVAAYVLPDPIFGGMPIPFQAYQDWDLLLLWAKNMAYRKQDADVLDLARADAFRNEYLSTVRDRRYEIDRILRNNAILDPS